MSNFFKQNKDFYTPKFTCLMADGSTWGRWTMTDGAGLSTMSVIFWSTTLVHMKKLTNITTNFEIPVGQSRRVTRLLLTKLLPSAFGNGSYIFRRSLWASQEGLKKIMCQTIKTCPKSDFDISFKLQKWSTWLSNFLHLYLRLIWINFLCESVFRDYFSFL